MDVRMPQRVQIEFADTGTVIAVLSYKGFAALAEKMH